MIATPAFWRHLLFCLLLLALWSVNPLQAAELRVALVIGNSSYSDKPLRNPVNDAQDLAAALKRMGFEVMEVVGKYLDYELDRVWAHLRGDLRPHHNLGVFAWLWSDASGSGLFLPTDAPPTQSVTDPS